MEAAIFHSEDDGQNGTQRLTVHKRQSYLSVTKVIEFFVSSRDETGTITCQNLCS